MDAELLKQLRAELEHDRDDLLSTLKDLGAGTDEALGEMLAAGIAELRLALEKLDRGEFGKCESCGKFIDESRLRKLPSARDCQRCEIQSTHGAQA